MRGRIGTTWVNPGFGRGRFFGQQTVYPIGGASL